MNVNGLLQFDEDGRLYIDHYCETCEKFPLENIDEPCLSCGHSQANIITLEKLVKRANKALDLIGDIDDDGIDVREAWLQLSSIKLGNGLDQVVFTDIDMTDEIRKLADLTEHMCRVIIYPTNIRHIEGDDYYEDEFYEDEYED